MNLVSREKTNIFFRTYPLPNRKLDPGQVHLYAYDRKLSPKFNLKQQIAGSD